jgi:hypothetical protein
LPLSVTAGLSPSTLLFDDDPRRSCARHPAKDGSAAICAHRHKTRFTNKGIRFTERVAHAKVYMNHVPSHGARFITNPFWFIGK